MWPTIRIFLGTDELEPVRPPASVAPRAWILGVVSVQATVEAGRPVARLRAHVTGAPAPRIHPLSADEVIHVTLAPPDPVLPALAPTSAPLSVHLDGQLLGEAHIRATDPPPRAFGHVFCRYLRDGGCETGFDLTDFLALPAGTKYERLVSRELPPGRVVSFRFRAVPRQRGSGEPME